MTMLRSLFVSTLLVSSLLLFVGCPTDIDDPVDHNDPIGIYNGDGSWSEFSTAVAAALDSLGRDIEFFDETDAQSGLDGLSMVVFSGGDPLQMAAALGFTGRENIKQLVRDGGGFLGLGGGAYLAADTLVYNEIGSIGSPPIGLYDGWAYGPITTLAPAGTYSMALVALTDTDFDPTFIESIQSMYRGGPEWQIGSPVHYEIAKFVQTGGSAGVIFSLGFGRVALLSFHPEIEEDNPRDGTAFGDDLEDPESEWFLVRTVTEWCLREF
jgi:Biotin-protein ligase, N terminal